MPRKDDQTGLQNYHTGFPQERMTRNFGRFTEISHKVTTPQERIIRQVD